MAKKLNPRHGSMQFWPRVRAKRQYPRIRSLPIVDEAGIKGFAGYKAGMTSVILRDNDKNSLTKNERISVPATIIECPPLYIHAVRLYSKSGYGVDVSKELIFKSEKNVVRKTRLPSSFSSASDLDSVSLEGVEDVTVVLCSSPSSLSKSKKMPELFEMGVGGKTVADKIEFIKGKLGSPLQVADSIKPGSYVDARAITTGRGYQGPVKRFGIGLRAAKSEKTKRGPGSLGGWKGHGHFMYRIAHAGTMGYHQRMQHNNYVLEVGTDVSKVNAEGGFINYGLVKNPYVLIRGSVPGPKRRLVFLTAPHRKAKQFAAPTVESIKTQSNQGN